MNQKVAIVTGISKGIGKEAALFLSKDGIIIVGSYWKDDSNAASLKSLLESQGAKCSLVKGDIKKLSTINKIVNTALIKYGRIDYLVNNASHYERLSFNQITNNNFLEMLTINVVSSFLLIQKVVPYMMEQKFGKIINISSFTASNGHPYSCHYTSSKAALEGMTKSLSLELAPYIRVNCVAPGYILNSENKSSDNIYKKERASKIPLGHLGKPSDVANLICYLISDESNYITGEIIKVSGGI